MNKNKILVLAPHTDDGELGCGATISKLINEGKDVYYVAFSICEESVPEGLPKNILETEVKKATKKLNISPENLIIKKFKVRYFPENRQQILEEIVSLNREIQPDLVFTPSSFDVHQDHKTIFEEARRAFKNTSILGYEFMW
ncbi:MAG: PIG-L deacetylase family protein, partial [Candidatus Paceibacterota bacterium]